LNIAYPTDCSFVEPCVSIATQAAAFDLTAIRHGQAPDPEIYAGDIVIVDGSSVKQSFKRVMQSFPMLSIFRPF